MSKVKNQDQGFRVSSCEKGVSRGSRLAEGVEAKVGQQIIYVEWWGCGLAKAKEKAKAKQKDIGAKARATDDFLYKGRFAQISKYIDDKGSYGRWRIHMRREKIE